MKRLLLIPVMFVYLFAVSGIMISLHYCGQELESWNVFSKTGCEDGACDDESQESDGCCKDEVITAKITKDQHVAPTFKFKVPLDEWQAPLPVYPFVQALDHSAVTVKATAHQPNAPPGLWQQIPLYKLHSSFTYYG